LHGTQYRLSGIPQSLGEATLPGSIQVVVQAAESPYLVIGYDNGTVYVLRVGISP
jgi:hypothetical protein